VNTASPLGGLRMNVDANGHVMTTWISQDSYLVGPYPVYLARVTALRYLQSLGGWQTSEYLDAQESYSNTPLTSDTRLQSVVDASGSVIVLWPNQDGELRTRRYE
jgi:hypothetical protein